MKTQKETQNEISIRNCFLVKAVTLTDLGLHLLNLKHEPKLITHDYQYQINAHVKDFNLILMKSSTEVYLEFDLMKFHKKEYVHLLREALVDVMNLYGQLQKIYVLSKHGLFLTGFNHHNKIDKKNAYPVFAKYDPVIFYNKEIAAKTAAKFELDFYLMAHEDSNSIFDNKSI